MAKQYHMLINGELVGSDDKFTVLNPSTEEVLAEAPHATQAQADKAVAAAQQAWKSWSQASHEQRSAALQKA